MALGKPHPMWPTFEGMRTMNTVSKVFALIIMTASIAIISFLTGELVGMKSGYAYTQKMTTPMDAAYTVSLINLIENNMNTEAKEMLETKLDVYIINHWSASQCKLIGLNPFIKEESQNAAFYAPITYRKSNPSDNELINNHLKSIEEELQRVGMVEFLAIDICLDRGGRWNYEQKECENTPMP